jgi:hypothetical protein
MPIAKACRSGAAAGARTHTRTRRPECITPIAWLGRRKDKDGQPLISEEGIVAAERLSADFWFAGMMPRVTTNWSADAIRSGGRRAAPGIGVEMQDHVVAAGERVRRALAAAGPELSGILVDVCCHGKGLELFERDAGWPKRSAKVVLQIALTRLARHYGLGPQHATATLSRVRHWGAEGYRPGIDTPEPDDTAG